MEKILITGANGQLGRELYKQLKDKEYELYLSDVVEDKERHIHKIDILDEEKLNNILNVFKPTIIINSAAMTAVDLCETEASKAKDINYYGAKNLANLAKKCDAKLVQVSTDYVFDGNSITPYIETDMINPTSVYGSTKAAGEKAVLDTLSKYFIVRTAWLYGDGNNFVKTMLRLADTNPVIRVVNDQYGTPTSTKELAKLILNIMKTEEYGIYHATCEGSCSWYDFACEIFRLANKDVRVESITTKEYPTPTKRPAYSVLENKKYNALFAEPLKDWKEAIKEYMEEQQ